MTMSQRSIAINVAALLFLIAAGTASAQNSVNVTIPGNTLGDLATHQLTTANHLWPLSRLTAPERSPSHILVV